MDLEILTFADFEMFMFSAASANILISTEMSFL